MEKFGIFDLLDTLSAIMAADTPAKKPDEAAAAQETDGNDIGKITPQASDSAFAPPSYGTEKEGGISVAERNAFGAFLERHDAISKKIDKK